MSGNFTVFVDGAPFTVSFAEGSSLNQLPTANCQLPTDSEPAGTPVLAVMPGNVHAIAVSVGDEVKEGEEVAVIEAMKMENPVKAPCAGKVLTITAVKGGTVSMGEVMMTIG